MVAGLSPKAILNKIAGTQPREPPPSGYRYIRVGFENSPRFHKDVRNEELLVNGGLFIRCKGCGVICEENCVCKSDKNTRGTMEIAEKAHEAASKKACKKENIDDEARKAAERRKARENVGDGGSKGKAPDPRSYQKAPRDQRPQANAPSSRDPRTFYEILGISPFSTQEEILKAAKRKRIETHPDRFSGQNLGPSDVDTIIERSKMVGHAADILCDPTARLKYDNKLAKENAEKRRPKAAENGSQRKTTETQERRQEGGVPWGFEKFPRPQASPYRRSPFL